MIVGTAGHIDHGKTALVKALTGVDADRLKEEKARGITIDLGFAYLPGPDGRVTGFIDVPGHEKFVHTMLAGASGIDLALLVVATDDGVMPQTREHLAILDLLGVSRAIVALTKADLADAERRATVTAAIAQVLAPTALRDAPVIPVSSLTGEGIAALQAALAAADTALPARAGEEGRFRLAVDRCFTLAGVGTVVTGTVLSGVVAVGDQVVVSPRGLKARVRAIHAQNRPAQRGVAGQRCALNLAGDGIAKDAIGRGDVVLDPWLHAPTDRIDATMHLLPSAERPVGTWFAARLHHGSAEVGARIVPLGAPISPGGAGLVQLVLDRPVAAVIGDRFVLRDAAARHTIGGGRLLDLRAPPRKRRTPERLARIEALSTPGAADALAALLAAPPFIVDPDAFGRDHGLSDPQLAAALSEADARIIAHASGRLALSGAERHRFSGNLAAEVGLYHEANPEHQGIGREKLRLATAPRLPAPAFAAALGEEVRAGTVALDGSFVRLPGHAVRLDAPADALWVRVAPLLEGQDRFRPPRVRDLAGLLDVPEAEVRRVLKLCARLGRVDAVAHDHFFARATTLAMLALARDVAAGTPDGVLTAAMFRDRMDNGRKVAIQILDFFDRHGVTLRRGDLRRMNPHRLDLFGTEGLAEGLGREASPVGRPDFKSGWGSETVPGGFDSRSLPPTPRS